MKLLSIDPGLTRTGYAILQSVTKRHNLKSESLLLIKCDVIKSPPTYTLGEKLFTIYRALEDLIVEHSISDIAIETPFLGKNAQSYLKLGHILGIVHLLSEKYGVPVSQFPPQVVKKAVTGTGTASKDQVLAALLLQMKGLATPQYLDISDAIAVGLCAIRMSK